MVLGSIGQTHTKTAYEYITPDVIREIQIRIAYVIKDRFKTDTFHEITADYICFRMKTLYEEWHTIPLSREWAIQQVVEMLANELSVDLESTSRFNHLDKWAIQNEEAGHTRFDYRSMKIRPSRPFTFTMRY